MDDFFGTILGFGLLYLLLAAYFHPLTNQVYPPNFIDATEKCRLNGEIESIEVGYFTNEVICTNGALFTLKHYNPNKPK